MTCGLCFWGYDAQLLAHQGVHEGRLTRVGIANDVDESCFMLVFWQFLKRIVAGTKVVYICTPNSEAMRVLNFTLRGGAVGSSLGS